MPHLASSILRYGARRRMIILHYGAQRRMMILRCAAKRRTTLNPYAKGQKHKFFYPRFFPSNNPLRPLINGLKYFRISFPIRKDICTFCSTESWIWAENYFSLEYDSEFENNLWHEPGAWEGGGVVFNIKKRESKIFWHGSLLSK
jgi:hypothetical protein